MSYQRTAPAQAADGHRGLRLLALAAVTIGVLLLAAAAFVLSYPGIHAVALAAGVSPRLARLYPPIFDAMLVVACAAVLSLRGAGLFSRCYAWLSMLVLFAAAAGADTLHAAGVTLPRRPAAAAAAIIPWALVLIGFGLLLCMLRQARLRRAAAALPHQAVPAPSDVEARRRTDEQRPAAAPAAAEARPVARQAERDADLTADLAIETDPGHDDPASDEGMAWVPQARQEQPAGPARSISAFSPAPTMAPWEAGTGSRSGAKSDPEPGFEPEDDNGAFLGLLPGISAGPQPQPGTGPGAMTAPHASPAAQPPSETGIRPQPPPQPRSAPEADPGFSDAPAPDPSGSAEAGTTLAQGSPEPETTPEEAPEPETPSPAGAAAALPETPPAAEAEPALAEAQPAPAEAQPAPAEVPAGETAPAQAASAEVEPAPAEAEPAEPPAAETAPAGSEPAPAEPAPAEAAQFDRMRSSPVPPEA